MKDDNIDAIFFDWDGVIVDSMQFVAKGIQETAAFFGVRVNVEDVLKNYIQPKEAYYHSIGVNVDPKELTKRHLAFIEKNDEPAALYPEVIEALTVLRNKGYKLGVVSSRSKEEMSEEISRLRLEQFFNKSMLPGGEPNKKGKLSTIIELFKVDANNAIYVGDLPTDITVGRKAGMKTVGIWRDTLAQGRLKNEQPDYLIGNLKELESVL